MAKETSQPKKETPAKKGLLKRRIKTPGSGRLGASVRMPKGLRAIGRYFKGSWHELREVRWPTRRATWGLTAAVLVFSAILGGFILGLDFGFEQLFKKVIL